MKCCVVSDCWKTATLRSCHDTKFEFDDLRRAQKPDPGRIVLLSKINKRNLQLARTTVFHSSSLIKNSKRQDNTSLINLPKCKNSVRDQDDINRELLTIQKYAMHMALPDSLLIRLFINGTLSSSRPFKTGWPKKREYSLWMQSSGERRSKRSGNSDGNGSYPGGARWAQSEWDFQEGGKIIKKLSPQEIKLPRWQLKGN